MSTATSPVVGVDAGPEQVEARWVWLWALVVLSPLVVALVVLSTRHWFPTLDLAMTELRVRDVGTANSPLIGLPGRIGTFPDQGSHPGPLSFWLVAPVYRIFGSTSFGLEVGAFAINAAAAVGALFIARRRGGRALVLGVALVLAVLVRGLGVTVLTQPWNPYLPIVAWLVVMLAVWSVLSGDHRMLVPLVLAGSLGAQTHISYLVPVGAMVVLAFGSVAWRARLGAEPGSERAGALRSVALAVAVGLVLWTPTVIDQLTNDPGNLEMLEEHFASPAEETLGLKDGAVLALRHLDVAKFAGRLWSDSGVYSRQAQDLEGGRSAIGAIVLALWLASVAVAARLRHRDLLRLDLVIGVALAVGVLTMSRIFGKIWFYLTLWSWVVALLAVLAIGWTALVWWSRNRPSAGLVRRLIAALSVAIVASTALFMVDAATAQPPEARLSRSLRGVVAPTVAALHAGEGAASGVDGRYLVTWSDAYFFGSAYYGLVSELERAGFDVGVEKTFRVPVTEHRVLDPAEATAQVHLATGLFVDQWRARPGVVEVAYFEPRNAEQKAEFAELRERTITRLNELGLTDVVPRVDGNLFGVQIDLRVPPDVQALVARMLDLGQPMAVFVAPPGTL